MLSVPEALGPLSQALRDPTPDTESPSRTVRRTYWPEKS